jgi:dipeptidase E
MKLYLSSYMLGDHTDQLHALAAHDRPRMAIITNALDSISIESQIAYTKNKLDIIDHFYSHGFDPERLDLRYFFGRSEALRDLLARRHIIWAVGGNAFLLRKAMQASGFDGIIRDLLEDGIVYAGWSAGACVAGDDMRAVGLMDAPEATAPGYEAGAPCWEGLGLLPYTIIPHFESDHPESELANNAVRWAAENAVDYRALRDGEVLICDGDETRLFGRVK